MATEKPRVRCTGPNIYARMGFGGLAGSAATWLMDNVTELFYSEDIARRESAVQEQSVTRVLAKELLQSLGLRPSDKDVQRVAPILHWAFGISCGVLAGAFARRAAARACFLVGAGMFAFDEIGLTLLGAAPPSARYPWQTNLRSLLGHATYGLSLAMAYEVLRQLSAGAD